MKITKFQELQIWKDALVVTKVVYDCSGGLKFSKDFALRDQIRRAVISISSNIVEGFEKNNNNEFIRFLKIAKGSTGEVINQLHIALAIDYVTHDEFNKIIDQLERLGSQIGAFISYLEKARQSNQFRKK